MRVESGDAGERARLERKGRISKFGIEVSRIAGQRRLQIIELAIIENAREN